MSIASSKGSLRARIVRVTVAEGATGLLFARSPDLRGLLASEQTLPALWAVVPVAIRDIFAAEGERFVVARVDAADDGAFTSWVAFPAAIASRELAALAALA